MSNNAISFVSEKAFVNLPQQTEIYFDMHCGGCNNIPFWRWVKLSQRTGLYITCNDFPEKPLSSLQQQDFIGCPGQSTTTTLSVTGRQSTTTTGQSTTTTPSVTGTNGGNGSVWCSRQGDWKWLVYMFFMISFRYIMSNI